MSFATNGRLRLAALLPTAELAGDAGAIREWAHAAEALGFDQIVVYDHVLGAPHDDRRLPMLGPYTEDDAFDEAMVLLGFLAGTTDLIGLRTGILVMPQRQTALLAKQAAEVDLLSNERLVLGVGAGWNHVEYDALGADFTSRGARLVEQIEVARLLWTEPLVTFTGDEHVLDRCGLNPLPRRSIPVWMGGASTAAVRRAATIADGFTFGMPGSFTTSLVTQLHDALESAGRDVDSFAMDVMVDYSRGVDRIARTARRWHADGGSWLTVRTTDAGAERLGAPRNDFGSVEHHIAALSRCLSAIRE